MNSYFATVEQQSNPFLRGNPICVAGKGEGERTVCAALSIEAKKFGLKSGVNTWEARAACPKIKIVPADYQKYQFISRQVFTLLEEYAPHIEIFSIDEAFANLDHIKTYTEAAILSQEIKYRIRTEIGDYLKCSVGLAENKLLAKLASEMQKPDGLTMIKKDNITAVLARTPIEDLCGVGRRLHYRLNQLGIKTAGELGRYPLSDLMKLFGRHAGLHLQQMGQGIDHSPVLSYREAAPEKSFGHSYTLPKDIHDISEVKKVLLKLAEKAGRRLRHKGFFGRTVHLYLRFSDFTSFGQQLSTHYLQDGYEIYQAGVRILQRYDIKKPIRLVGISIGNLSKTKDISQTILVCDQKQERILQAADAINDRFGEFTLFRSALTKIKDRIENIPDGRNKRIM